MKEMRKQSMNKTYKWKCDIKGRNILTSGDFLQRNFTFCFFYPALLPTKNKINKCDVHNCVIYNSLKDRTGPKYGSWNKRYLERIIFFSPLYNCKSEKNL